MEITIACKDFNDLKVKLAELCKALGLEVHDTQLSLPLKPVEVSEKKNKKNKKDEEPVKADPFVLEQTPQQTVTISYPTNRAAAKAALEKVTQEKSMNDAHAIVLKLGVNRFSEIPEDKYPDLITECNKVLGLS